MPPDVSPPPARAPRPSAEAPARLDGDARTRDRSPRRPRIGPHGVLRAVLLVALASALILLLTRGTPAPGIEVERREPAPGIDELRVHVSGAVRAPTVVTASPGERVGDVVARAGAAADADLGALNLARRVVDQDRVVVPRAGEGPRLLEHTPH